MDMASHLLLVSVAGPHQYVIYSGIPTACHGPQWGYQQLLTGIQLFLP